MKNEPLTLNYVVGTIAAGVGVLLFCAFSLITEKIRMGIKGYEVPVYGRLAKHIAYFLAVCGAIWIVGALLAMIFSSMGLLMGAFIFGFLVMMCTWIIGTTLGLREQKKKK